MNLNLVQQSELAVKRNLESSLEFMRRENYDLKREFSFFAYEFTRSVIKYFREGNKLLLDGLREKLDEGFESGTIADFCCGSGKLTMRLAKAFPKSRVYGFDAVLVFIKKAKKKSKKNDKVSFAELDVYNFSLVDSFDAITFNRACGNLSDKIIQYGAENNIPVIAGRFCCHHTISEETPRSKDRMHNIWLRIETRIREFIKEKHARNYVTPSDEIDRDLLSRYVQEELEVSDHELMRIASTTIDSKLGIRFIDYNRVMKLIERGYDVSYEESNNLLVAARKTK